MHGGGGGSDGTGSGGRGGAQHPNRPSGDTRSGGAGRVQSEVGGGGGMSFLFEGSIPNGTNIAPLHTQAILVAGGGGGSSNQYEPGSPNSSLGSAGAGGGLIGGAGGTNEAQTTADYISNPNPSFPHKPNGGGGSQTGGGDGGSGTAGSAQAGGRFYGGDGLANPNGSGGAGGGAGYYGGGGSSNYPTGGQGSGGGGSSYYGHPSVTLGITVHGQNGPNGAAWGSARMPSCRTSDDSQPDDPGTSPQFSDKSIPDITVAVACAADIGGLPVAPQYGYSAVNNGDGYVIFRTRTCAAVQNTTIMSTAFSATSVPTTSRIVVFEENVTTPTLNTDIIASVSRDGGTTFTNATLSDSGYVTGTSGQRILTGQATISGQPSGQSMRWKLALANNTVKIHGVALQWS